MTLGSFNIPKTASSAANMATAEIWHVQQAGEKKTRGNRMNRYSIKMRASNKEEGHISGAEKIECRLLQYGIS